jgi:hypothetical protein
LSDLRIHGLADSPDLESGESANSLIRQFANPKLTATGIAPDLHRTSEEEVKPGDRDIKSLPAHTFLHTVRSAKVEDTV